MNGRQKWNPEIAGTGRHRGPGRLRGSGLADHGRPAAPGQARHPRRYDLSNAALKHIDFTRGGIITAILSVLVLPWKVFANPVAVNYFLGGLGAFLGPLFAIIVTDYYLIRRGQLKIPDLYRDDPAGEYTYSRGFNPNAVIAFVVAAAVAAVVALVKAFADVAPFSWFIGAALGAVIYYPLAMRKGGVRAQAEPSASSVH